MKKLTDIDSLVLTNAQVIALLRRVVTMCFTDAAAMNQTMRSLATITEDDGVFTATFPNGQIVKITPDSKVELFKDHVEIDSEWFCLLIPQCYSDFEELLAI